MVVNCSSLRGTLRHFPTAKLTLPHPILFGAAGVIFRVDVQMIAVMVVQPLLASGTSIAWMVGLVDGSVSRLRQNK